MIFHNINRFNLAQEYTIPSLIRRNADLVNGVVYHTLHGGNTVYIVLVQ
jgi:hypothetical protein